MESLKHLYGAGRVGMIVVLDHVSLSITDPFVKYQQPAFFTIVEDLSPENRRNGIYVLRDSEGNLIKTQAGDSTEPSTDSICYYLSEVSDWSRWNTARTREAVATRDATIYNLQVRVGTLREVLVEQGFRVITSEQAAVLGIKP